MLLLVAAALATGLAAGWLLARGLPQPSASFTPLPLEPRRKGLEASLRQPYSGRLVRVTATAYSSTPDQTDSTPTITFTGKRVHPGVLAVSPDLIADGVVRFGDQVRLDGKTYVVEDLMHHRWRRRVDVWMPSRGEALRWGVRTMEMEVP